MGTWRWPLPPTAHSCVIAAEGSPSLVQPIGYHCLHDIFLLDPLCAKTSRARRICRRHRKIRVSWRKSIGNENHERWLENRRPQRRKECLLQVSRKQTKRKSGSQDDVYSAPRPVIQAQKCRSHLVPEWNGPIFQQYRTQYTSKFLAAGAV